MDESGKTEAYRFFFIKNINNVNMSMSLMLSHRLDMRKKIETETYDADMTTSQKRKQLIEATVSEIINK
jgi:hypothetical protein